MGVKGEMRHMKRWLTPKNQGLEIDYLWEYSWKITLPPWQFIGALIDGMEPCAFGAIVPRPMPLGCLPRPRSIS